MNNLLEKIQTAYQQGKYEIAKRFEAEYFDYAKPKPNLLPNPEPIRPYVFEGGVECLEDL